MRFLDKVKLALSFVMIAPAMALAQLATPVPGEPQSMDQVLGFLPLIMDLIKSSQYLAAGAAITLIGVFLFRKFVMVKMKLKPGVLPIISAVLGVVAGSALALANGAPKDAALLALLSGPAASQLWDAILKYMFKKPELG